MAEVEYAIGDEYTEKVNPLIQQAKKNIDIVVFDWRHYPNEPASRTSQFNLNIAEAIKRGVQVRAIVNSPDIQSFLKKIGAKARIVNSKHLVHAKVILIDDQIAVIGSHNFTSHAFAVNFETSAIITDTETQTRLREFFETLWQL